MGLSKIVDEASINLLKNHIAGDKTQKMFAHTKSFLIDNDLPEHNVTVNKERTKITAVYDRENAVIFDPICELGSLPTRVSQYPKKQKLIE
jgi:aminoglycoside phosphotransferase (APT) family kinase protein